MLRIDVKDLTAFSDQVRFVQGALIKFKADLDKTTQQIRQVSDLSRKLANLTFKV